MGSNARSPVTIVAPPTTVVPTTVTSPCTTQAPPTHTADGTGAEPTQSDEVGGGLPCVSHATARIGITHEVGDDSGGGDDGASAVGPETDPSAASRLPLPSMT